jgi:hypothetical protein
MYNKLYQIKINLLILQYKALIIRYPTKKFYNNIKMKQFQILVYNIRIWVEINRKEEIKLFSLLDQ